MGAFQNKISKGVKSGPLNQFSGLPSALWPSWMYHPTCSSCATTEGPPWTSPRWTKPRNSQNPSNLFAPCQNRINGINCQQQILASKQSHITSTANPTESSGSASIGKLCTAADSMTCGLPGARQPGNFAQHTTVEFISGAAALESRQGSL